MSQKPFCQVCKSKRKNVPSTHTFEIKHTHFHLCESHAAIYERIVVARYLDECRYMVKIDDGQYEMADGLE